MKNIKTFAFLDTETTGLPHLESYKTKITELCIVVVQSSHLKLGLLPRVQNKLSLCFNPGKYITKEATDLTGLDNFLLEHQTNFKSDTVTLINQFLETQEKPICLVAHNGNQFDFPILKREIHRTGEYILDDLLCIDSLEAFRDLHKHNEETTEITQESSITVPFEFQDGYDELLCQIADELEQKSMEWKEKKSVEEIQTVNETTPGKRGLNDKDNISVESPSTSNVKPTNKTRFKKLKLSFKLKDLYQRLTRKEASEAHKAECDVTMLIECATVCGEEFINWAKKKAKPFNKTPLLKV